MPPTRGHLRRDVKADAILAAAETRLRAGGYHGMSVAAVARELGVAQNSIYWYFPSKDDLLIALVGRRVREIYAGKPPDLAGPSAKILWVAERLAEIEPLRSAVRERALVSDVVAGFDDSLTATLEGTLANVLRDSVDPDDLDDVVVAYSHTVHGVLAKNLPPVERARILRFALRRIAGLTD